MIQENFVKNLRNAMESKGMSRADLARVTGLRPTYISCCILGGTGVNLENLEIIAKALDTTPGKLLGYEESHDLQNAQYKRMYSTLEQLERCASQALHKADVVYDDLTRPSYTYDDEMIAVAICYGELAGMVRLIHEMAKYGMELPAL